MIKAADKAPMGALLPISEDEKVTVRRETYPFRGASSKPPFDSELHHTDPELLMVSEPNSPITLQ
jgi:hypothetical protein